MSLSIDAASGLLLQARQVPSPNYNQRPAATAIDLIVVHGISLPPGQFGGPWIDALFTNTLHVTADPFFVALKDLQVSSHLLIRRDGELVQYVSFGLRAWHAGRSSFQGRDNCNDFSIGIELEGTDTEPYEEIQYRRLATVVQRLQQTYPAIDSDRIVGHTDIAPGRKTDPGEAFDWSYLRSLLRGPAATNSPT